MLDGGPDPPWEGAILGERGAHSKYTDTLRSLVRKWLNRSSCRFDCDLLMAQGSMN